MVGVCVCVCVRGLVRLGLEHEIFSNEILNKIQHYTLIKHGMKNASSCRTRNAANNSEQGVPLSKLCIMVPVFIFIIHNSIKVQISYVT